METNLDIRTGPEAEQDENRGPATAKPDKKSKKKVQAAPRENNMGRLLALCSTQKRRLLISAILSVLSALAGLVPYLLIYLIILELFEPPLDQAYVWWLAGFTLAAVILRYVLFQISTTLSHSAAFRIQYDLRVRLTAHMGRLPLGYYGRKSSGDLKKVLYDDVEQLELFIAHNLPDLAAAIALPLFTVIYLFFVDWQLALALLLILPLASWASTMMSPRGEARLQEIRDYFDNIERINSTVIEYIQGMPVIKAFNQTAYSFTRFRDAIQHSTDFNVESSRRAAPWFTLFLAFLTGGLLFVLPVGSWLYLSGNLSLATFILFLVVGLGFTASMTRLLYFSHMLPQLSESEKRVTAILNEKELPEPDATSAVVPTSFEIEFEEVTFRYKDNVVLNKLSFKAEAGQVTALVGPSGAGKTTAARLIPRFWDAESGFVRIGGQDIRRVPTEQLMGLVSFVFQDVYLFNDTVEANIKMGNPAATLDMVETAARTARCHDFILALPQGYQTVIGERGAKLSGGEKQRISIARAILKNAPIVVFDEATAFIDPENEGQIQEAISELTEGKTLLIIAHRLSTITEADRIVVMDKGQAVAEGQHEELLETSPLYRSLWKAHMDAQSWQFGHESPAALSPIEASTGN